MSYLFLFFIIIIRKEVYFPKTKFLTIVIFFILNIKNLHSSKT